MKITISQSAATSILFHATNLSKLNTILTDDKFELTTCVGIPAENEYAKEYYYLSMTRSRLGDYHLRNCNTGDVLITLDGNKLNQRYKTKPIDYWGEERRKYTGGSYEAEDRLFTNDPFIDKASQYIVEISIIVKPEDIAQRGKFIRSVMLKAKYKHIPMYIFSNPKDWLTNNKAKAYKIATIKINPQSVFERIELPDYEQDYYNILRADDKKRYQEYQNSKQSNLVNVLELYYKKSFVNLSPSAKKYAHLLMGDYNDDRIMSIKSDIHNDRSGHSRDGRVNVNSIVSILKKEHCTIDELMRMLKAKWRKLDNL